MADVGHVRLMTVPQMRRTRRIDRLQISTEDDKPPNRKSPKNPEATSSYLLLKVDAINIDISFFLFITVKHLEPIKIALLSLYSVNIATELSKSFYGNNLIFLYLCSFQTKCNILVQRFS